MALATALASCASPEPTARVSDTPAAADAAAGPPIPFEDPGACPFEGCVYREWITNAPVDALTERRDEAAVAFRVASGERVTALTGVVVTTRPGRVSFMTPAEIFTGAGPIRMEAGEFLYLLTPKGEGFFTAWAHGQRAEDVDGTAFCEGPCPAGVRRCIGQLEDRVQYTWWVQIRNATGQTGWTRFPERFDGKDALG